jgi:hypothetical protein
MADGAFDVGEVGVVGERVHVGHVGALSGW